MAGNERSGRRKIAETTARLPRVGNTEDEIRRYISAVLRGLAKEKIDPRVADTMLKGAKASLAALRQRDQRQEVDELKALLEGAREMAREGREREVADRQHKKAT